MLIVDAQVHPWEHGTSTGHHRREPLTVEALKQEMEAAGVDRVLLVPPLWDTQGNTYALAAAKADPTRFAVMGLLQIGAEPPARDADSLRAWAGEPGLIGLRFLFNAPDRIAPLLAGDYDWVWPAAEAAGLPVALLVPNALPIAADIARKYPGLKVIVDHLGVPRGATGPSAFAHLPDLLALGGLPNIFVKAVGVCDYALDDYPYPSLDDPMRRIFDAFSPQKVIWGSDLSRLRHSYRDCVRHFTDALPELSKADRADVMGLNLCRLTGWDPGQATD